MRHNIQARSPQYASCMSNVKGVGGVGVSALEAERARGVGITTGGARAFSAYSHSADDFIHGISVQAQRQLRNALLELSAEEIEAPASPMPALLASPHHHHHFLLDPPCLEEAPVFRRRNTKNKHRQMYRPTGTLLTCTAMRRQQKVSAYTLSLDIVLTIPQSSTAPWYGGKPPRSCLRRRSHSGYVFNNIMLHEHCDISEPCKVALSLFLAKSQ